MDAILRIREIPVLANACIRCRTSNPVRTTQCVGVDATTRTPLRPDGTLTAIGAPDYRVGLLCDPCDTIITLTIAEVGMHTNDLITFFKVIFPHGRYDLITDAQPAAPHEQHPTHADQHGGRSGRAPVEQSPSVGAIQSDLVHGDPAATTLRELIERHEPTLLPTIEYARHEARAQLGAALADLIEWETDERHDRLYGRLNHGDDSVTIFYDGEAVWANLLVTRPCPIEPTCPLGYDIATSGNLLRVLNGGETEDPHCPVHAAPDTY